jgi:DNA-binding response OmpR family regulator
MVYETLLKFAQLHRSVLTGCHISVLEWRGPVFVGENGSPMPIEAKQLVQRFAAAKVLVVDDEHCMRKVVRTMLMSIGVREMHEAPDGAAGLELIRTVKPDVVILDWQMPGLDGPSIVRMIRSPETFPYPDVPIIMLTGHGERSHVIEAVKIGVNEFLLKPVSVKALQDRMTAVLTQPRQIMKDGNDYGPAPRNLTTAIHADNDQAIAKLAVVN